MLVVWYPDEMICWCEILRSICHISDTAVQRRWRRRSFTKQLQRSKRKERQKQPKKRKWKRNLILNNINVLHLNMPMFCYFPSWSSIIDQTSQWFLSGPVCKLTPTSTYSCTLLRGEAFLRIDIKGRCPSISTLQWSHYYWPMYKYLGWILAPSWSAIALKLAATLCYISLHCTCDEAFPGSQVRIGFEGIDRQWRQSRHHFLRSTIQHTISALHLKSSGEIKFPIFIYI